MRNHENIEPKRKEPKKRAYKKYLICENVDVYLEKGRYGFSHRLLLKLQIKSDPYSTIKL